MSETDHNSSTNRIWPATLVSLLATMGSLWLSLGMGLKACPLCYYQRTFVMGVFGILCIGVVVERKHRVVLPVLALPLAVGAFGVAAFHVFLEWSGKLECPLGVMGFGTAPQQSFAVLTLLLLLLAFGALRVERRLSVSIAAVILGVLFAIGAVLSAPPLPKPPTERDDSPLEMCRPPFQPG